MRNGVASSPTPITVGDLVPSFLNVWERYGGRSPDEFASAWTTEYHDRLPEPIQRSLERHRFSGDLVRAIPMMPDAIASLLPRRDAVQRESTNAIRHYIDLVGVEVEPFRLVTLVGLFNSDGWVEWQDRQVTLLIAVEALESVEQAEVLVRHEIAHVLHLQPMDDSDRWDIGDALFEEGLATALSGVGTDLSEGMLCGAGRTATWEGEPVNAWANRCEASWPAVRARLLTTFSSEASNDYEALFLGGSNAPDIPSRAGYYAGLRLVRELADRASWPDIVGWDRNTVRSAMLRALSSEPGDGEISKG